MVDHVCVVLQVNLFAVIALTQAVAPYMIEQRSGLIGEAAASHSLHRIGHLELRACLVSLTKHVATAFRKDSS